MFTPTVRCERCRRRITTHEGEQAPSGGLVCYVCLLACDPPAGFPELVETVTTSGKSLRGFQKDGVRWIATRRRALVADQMGVGKGVQACIGVLRADCPNIAIVPASLRWNWEREVREWRPDLLPIIVMRGLAGAIERAKLGDVLIASYQSLPGGRCAGCRSRGVRACAHTGPDMAHPEWITVRGRREPYCLPIGLKSDKPEQRRKAEEKLKKILTGELPPAGRIRWQESPLPSIARPYVLVGDEIHAVKSPEAQQTKKWRELAARVSRAGGYVYGLTGTPAENHPQEYWEVLCGLGLERAAFGAYQVYESLFWDWYGREKGQRRPPSGAQLQEVMVRLGRVRIHRRTKDVLKDLPPIQVQDVTVEITKERMDEINEAVQRMFAQKRAWEDVGKGALLNPFAQSLTPDERARRRTFYDRRSEEYFQQKPWKYDQEVAEAVEQVISPDSWSPTIHDMARIRRLLSLAKIEAVEEWVASCAEQEEPIVLFCQHTQIVKRFAAMAGWVGFHGGLDDAEKADAVLGFQEGRYERGIALSIGAGREGITLTRARVAGFVDLNWNPARNRQAVARLRRIGSEHHESILVVRFVADHPVDKHVLKTLAEKERLLDALDAHEVVEPGVAAGIAPRPEGLEDGEAT